MASLFRTASMAVSKKHSKAMKIQRGMVAGGRRHTMMPPQPMRDSVLSNGSSDRSSSISDENPPAPPETGTSYGTDLFGFEAEEQIRDAWPLKCCFVVKEIMQTEIAYIQSLADIIKGYLTPLYSHLLNSGESANFIKTVFSNIVKIHQTHQELMEGFQDTFASPQDFASNFVRVDFISLYSIYCISYPQGNECLEKALHENEELREFLEHCQHILGHSLPLSSQLIKPVQRILKYRLLLEELNKHFDHEHPAYHTVHAALVKMSSVAEEINTSFSSQKSSPKSVPSAVAKRRTHQLRDLQRSRLSRGSRLSQRSSSETHLNFPSRDETLPNGNVGWPIPISTRSKTPEDSDRGLGDSLPNVKQLKSYFEKLTKEGEEEKIRRQSISQKAFPGGMRKANSMAGTRRDSISTVGLGSPRKSPSWSPVWSPTKSPIKVPVLPRTPSHSPPSKSPRKTPPKSPSKPAPTRSSPQTTPQTPPRSPSKIPFRSPTMSPSKAATLTSPLRALASTLESPSRARRRPSWGSLCDLKSHIGIGAGEMNHRKMQFTQEETCETSMSVSRPQQTPKSVAAGRISEEIKRQIAAAAKTKRGQSMVPRTMV